MHMTTGRINQVIHEVAEQAGRAVAARPTRALPRAGTPRAPTHPHSHTAPRHHTHTHTHTHWDTHIHHMAWWWSRGEPTGSQRRHVTASFQDCEHSNTHTAQQISAHQHVHAHAHAHTQKACGTRRVTCDESARRVCSQALRNQPRGH